jgi:hypothetical protein
MCPTPGPPPSGVAPGVGAFPPKGFALRYQAWIYEPRSWPRPRSSLRGPGGVEHLLGSVPSSRTSVTTGCFPTCGDRRWAVPYPDGRPHIRNSRPNQIGVPPAGCFAREFSRVFFPWPVPCGSLARGSTSSFFDRSVRSYTIYSLSFGSRSISGVDPTWADPVYSHPAGSLKGSAGVPSDRGSFLDRDPFIM